MDSRTRMIRKTISLLVSMVKCGDEYDDSAESMVNLAFRAIEGHPLSR